MYWHFNLLFSFYFLNIRQRWERCKRELEMTKQRLKQREQDHLDQIMIMKKSLEKKVCKKYIKINLTFIWFLSNKLCFKIAVLWRMGRVRRAKTNCGTIETPNSKIVQWAVWRKMFTSRRSVSSLSLGEETTTFRFWTFDFEYAIRKGKAEQG